MVGNRSSFARSLCALLKQREANTIAGSIPKTPSLTSASPNRTPTSSSLHPAMAASSCSTPRSTNSRFCNSANIRAKSSHSHGIWSTRLCSPPHPGTAQSKSLTLQQTTNLAFRRSPSVHAPTPAHGSPAARPSFPAFPAMVSAASLISAPAKAKPRKSSSRE